MVEGEDGAAVCTQSGHAGQGVGSRRKGELLPQAGEGTLVC